MYDGHAVIQKISVPEKAREYIDFNKPLSPGVCGGGYFTRKIAEALPGELTAYNLRHTIATICQKYVRPDIVDIWPGDSPERLVGRVYTHFDDDFMKKQMNKVIFVT